ncbi:hypothetical protein FQA39_LY15521 [Lamprigera yunnana]|nr:hypothetical protein FQA39_LY15521 [Lamprigera yunnana]
MHSRGKKLVNLALLEGNKQVDNNATPTGSSEVQMNDVFNDFGSDDSVADKDYVPSATFNSESELDVGGKSDSESDILNAENIDTEVENTQEMDCLPHQSTGTTKFHSKIRSLEEKSTA